LRCARDYAYEAILHTHTLAPPSYCHLFPTLLLTSFPSALYGEKCSESSCASLFWVCSAMIFKVQLLLSGTLKLSRSFPARERHGPWLFLLIASLVGELEQGYYVSVHIRGARRYMRGAKLLVGSELLSGSDKEVHGGGDGGVLETRGGLGRCCLELFKLKGEEILLMCNACEV
jgi:hypothetical protein